MSSTCFIPIFSFLFFIQNKNVLKKRNGKPENCIYWWWFHSRDYLMYLAVLIWYKKMFLVPYYLYLNVGRVTDGESWGANKRQGLSGGGVWSQAGQGSGVLWKGVGGHEENTPAHHREPPGLEKNWGKTADSTKSVQNHDNPLLKNPNAEGLVN